MNDQEQDSSSFMRKLVLRPLSVPDRRVLLGGKGGRGEGGCGTQHIVNKGEMTIGEECSAEEEDVHLPWNGILSSCVAHQSCLNVVSRRLRFRVPRQQSGSTVGSVIAGS